MRSKAGKTRRGFTLIEAMVAAALLAVGVVGVIGLQASLFHTARFSADMSNAANILNHRVEELSLRGVTLLGATCAGAAPGCLAAGAYGPPAACTQFTAGPIDLGAAGGPGIGPASPYRIDTGLVAHDAAHPNARVATVSVCWTDAAGRVRQIRAVRVLGDR